MSKPKKQRPKQEHLPGEGMAPPSIPAIDRAVERYVEVQTDRIVLTAQETEARDEVAALMGKHGLTRYQSDGYDVALAPKVKVSRHKEPKTDGPESTRARLEV